MLGAPASFSLTNTAPLAVASTSDAPPWLGAPTTSTAGEDCGSSLVHSTIVVVWSPVRSLLPLAQPCGAAATPTGSTSMLPGAPQDHRDHARAQRTSVDIA